jgi:hypothetical protein
MPSLQHASMERGLVGMSCPSVTWGSASGPPPDTTGYTKSGSGETQGVWSQGHTAEGGEGGEGQAAGAGVQRAGTLGRMRGDTSVDWAVCVPC